MKKSDIIIIKDKKASLTNTVVQEDILSSELEQINPLNNKKAGSPKLITSTTLHDGFTKSER